MSTVNEYEAAGKIEEVYFDICQSFSVSGVNLIFRKLAAYEDFFLKMWQEVQPLVVSSDFCKAADKLRLEAGQAASKLKKTKFKKYDLGESQAYQVQAALDLYHYINPKLLLLVSHLQFILAEKDQRYSNNSLDSKRFLRGIPADMYPMEMISEKPKEPELKKVFRDIKETLNLKALNSDYRTLALWPEYLSKAWLQIKPLVKSQNYNLAVAELKNYSREIAVQLPPAKSGETMDFSKVPNLAQIKKDISYFEDILPGLILNISLLQLDWKSTEQLKTSKHSEKWQDEKGFFL